MIRSEVRRPIRIIQWSAWAPGVSTHEEWTDFFQGNPALNRDQEPDVSKVPALIRRRMSRLSRMAASSAFDCCRLANINPERVRAVFASRHGEMGVTVELLKQICAQETVSPMAFSGSVHHTAMGYFSIASGNRQAMRAVAGGEASFCYGFLEATGMINDRDDSPVLLIAADDELPEPFKKVGGPTPFPWAVTLLLGCGQARQETVLLEISDAAPISKSHPILHIPALEFLRWYLGDDKVFVQQLSRKLWRWQK